MSSSTSVEAPARSRRGAWIGGGVAVLIILIGGAWLARKPIAAGIGQSYCHGEGLACELNVSRLDFGGVAVRDLDVRALGAERPAVRAGELALELAWSFPLNFRMLSIGGDDLDLRVNLRGEGGLLGDLDEVVQRQLQQPREASSAPLPELSFRNVRIIGETEWGEVEAVGRFALSAAGDADIEFLAAPAQLRHSWGELDFGGAKLVAKVEEQNLFGTLSFDLARMTSGERQLSGANLQMDFSQSGGSLTARADGKVETAELPEGRLHGAQLHGDLLADAIDLSDLTLAAVASRIRQLTIAGGAAEGGLQNAELNDFTIAIDIDPSDEGGAAGDVRIAAAGLTHEMGRAQRVEIEGRVDVAGGSGVVGRTVRASGVARLRDAALDEATSDQLAKSLGALIGGALPTFGRAAESTVRRAGERFDLVLPWSFQLQDGESDVSALSGTELEAASGFALRLEGERGAPVVSWLASEGNGWRAQGVMTASGGGGPPVRLELAEARGGPDGVSVRASGSLASWAASDETLSAEVRDAAYASDGGTGKFSGGVTASISGVLGGVRWTRLRTNADIQSEWTPETFSTSSAQNLRLDWDGAQIGGTLLGGGALTYAPDGMLAHGDGGEVRGAGRLSGFESDLRGSNFTGELRVGGAQVAWERGRDMRAQFQLEPSHLLFLTGDGGVPVDVGVVVGEARLGNGWRVNGGVSQGGAVADTAAVKDVSAEFDLSGGGARKISGSLRNVSFVVTDPDQEGQLFEDLKFDGLGDLLGTGAATFSGRFVMVESGVQVGDVTGRHSMEEGRGEMVFAETPLIFRARGFQPKNLSPVLRGAANVDGRADVSGLASWSGEGLAASARVIVRGLGFAVASAGVFEGVNGAVEISDVLKMHSAPGQTLLIEKVTLGLPIEDGVLRFQMDGFDKVLLEDARWPFAGGMIRLDPAVFKFGPEENRITANAVDWDLTKIVELFKVPDTSVQGIVNGSFPVVFSTGSARIEDAVLEASDDGGVIKYGGATTDAAAQSNDNAKLLFDALKDFRYRVLKIGLNGDVAGSMLLTLTIEGLNPNVLSGAPFKLNIGIESELAELLNTLNRPKAEIDAVIRGGRQESN